MYFLEKFCRICVQTGGNLLDINMVDFDSVRLSEKLEICTKLVLNSEIPSREICQKCVNKLRVTYHFHDMCRKSTRIIENYLQKLTNLNNQNNKQFANSELEVIIEKLPDRDTIQSKNNAEDYDDNDEQIEINSSSKSTVNDSGLLNRKQRITKQQRCSLLKQLLIPRMKPTKERDKIITCNPKISSEDFDKGGLRNIINFTNNYEFNMKLNNSSNNTIISTTEQSTTPLQKLAAFSKNFFQRDFNDFKTHILHVIENENNDKIECNNNNIYSNNYSSDDDTYESESDTENYMTIRNKDFEEIIVEPDIKIKREIKNECEEEGGTCPIDYLETSLGVCKKDEFQSRYSSERKSKFFWSNLHTFNNDTKNKDQNFNLCQEQDEEQEKDEEIEEDLIQESASASSSSTAAESSMKLLGKLVSSYPINSRKIFSPSNVRCRTRNNPYINPLLKDQFLFRSFKCVKCNRYFKSQGYLKAHMSKVH